MKGIGLGGNVAIEDLDSKKRTYHKTYYLSHPELKTKAREREARRRANAFAYQKSKLRKQCRSKFNLVEAMGFLFLLAVFTSLLLRETAFFYSESKNPDLIAWTKACALEGAAIAFAMVTHKSLLKRVLYKTVAIGICVLSIYAMSIQQVGVGLGEIESKEITVKAIADTENAILAKSNQRDYLLAHGWVSAARKMESSIDGLRLKLDQLHARTLQLKVTQAVTHSTIVQVLLRVFLMIGNLLVAHRLGELFKAMKAQLEISRQETEISNRKLKISKPRDCLLRPDSEGPNLYWKWFIKKIAWSVEGASRLTTSLGLSR